MNMTKEKVTRGELIACESYADNGALSHYTFVDENGDIIGIFCDEDALIKNRMEREKAYAILFAAAPDMLNELWRSDDLLRDALKQLHKNSGLYREIEKQIEENKRVLKKARSEK